LNCHHSSPTATIVPTSTIHAVRRPLMNRQIAVTALWGLIRPAIVLIGVPGLAYNIFIGSIILGMMALHSWLERRHQAGT